MSLTTCDIFKVGLGAKVDVASPVVDVSSLKNGDYIRGTKTLSGSATDDTGVKSVTLIVNNGSVQLASIAATVNAETWTAVLDTNALAPSQEIQADLILRITDDTGKTSDKKLVLYFDNVAPSIASLSPTKENLEKTDTLMSGTVAFSGSIKDGLGVKDLVFTAGGIAFPLKAGTTPASWTVEVNTARNASNQPMFVPGTASGVVDLGGGQLKVPLKIDAVDNAGNSTSVQTFFYVDQNAAAPKIDFPSPFNPTILYPNLTPIQASNVLAPKQQISFR
ncbi:MAG TPA: Ig-like domain-containing protein, partial [Rectinemataceae bacterium]|nr:Ig-like domain-containing protein [Rectinemataceae bacterium]